VLDRFLRGVWLLGIPVGVGVAALVIVLARHHGPARPPQLAVHQATLRPGTIVLVVTNDSSETARVAQVILNDAFVDFRQSQRTVRPGDTERITVSYPWIRGEAYAIRLMTSSGATVDYQIDEAKVGTQAAEPA